MLLLGRYTIFDALYHKISLNVLENIYLTTLLTSPIEISLFFQNYVRHLNQNFREVRKIYEMGLRSKIMRVKLFYKVL